MEVCPEPADAAGRPQGYFGAIGYAAVLFFTTEETEIFGRGAHGDGGTLADRRVALCARLGPLGLLGSIQIGCPGKEHQHASSGSSHQVHADLAATARRRDGPHGFVRGLASVPSLLALRALRGERIPSLTRGSGPRSVPLRRAARRRWLRAPRGGRSGSGRRIPRAGT